MYVFKTSQFGFTDEELHLMNNGSAYKQIPFGDITSIDITKGAETRHQFQLLVFALILIGLAMFMIFSGLFAYMPEISGTTGDELDARGHGAMLAVFLFVLSLVIWSVYQVVVNRLTLVVIITDGTKEKLPLKPIKDTNRLIHFIEFLLSRFESSKLHFDRSAFQ